MTKGTNSYDVSELVPHSGKMSLLSRVVGSGEGWLKSEVDIHTSSMFAEAQGVPSYIGIEYMAQTIAAYAGRQEQLNGGKPKLGFLLGTRRYSVNADMFPIGSTLQVHVDCEMVAENGLHVFKAEIKYQEILATASLNVFQPENPENFLKESMK